MEEQAKIIKAQRSNCELDTTKLEAKLKEYGITVPEVHGGLKEPEWKFGWRIAV